MEAPSMDGDPGAASGEPGKDGAMPEDEDPAKALERALGKAADEDDPAKAIERAMKGEAKK